MISILLDFETKVEMAKLDKNPSCFFNNLSLFLFVSSSWIVSRSPRPLVQCVTSSGQIHWRSLDQKTNTGELLSQFSDGMLLLLQVR